MTSFLCAFPNALLSSSGKAAHDTRFAHEPQETEETNDREDGGCVEQGVEKDHGTRVGAGLEGRQYMPPPANGTEKHTLRVNVLNESLVIATASNAFEKIHVLTNFVRKLLYESSSVFCSTTFGST